MKIQRLITLSFHTILSLIVAFALTFTPFATFKLFEPVPKAEAAGALTGIATEFTQIANNALLGASNVINSTTAANTGITAANSVSEFLRENVLDGIGWTIAKTVVSSIVRSVINWVNSGFQGSPAFITDLKQHLLDIVDQAAGEYIRSLGEIGNFICSPFRLDVQAALQINYARSRSGMPSGGDENLCRVTEIGSNIENFLSGSVESMDQWLQVTSNPQNTPMGAYLTAEAHMNARLINAQGEEIQLANFGDGFLSQRVCEAVEGQSGQGRCTITTPGRVISEALTFQTSVGSRTLIEADEINELVGALLNQLVVQALQGMNGLLGLGGNSNFSNNDKDGKSYLDKLGEEAGGLNASSTALQIKNQIALEEKYLELIYETILRGEAILEADKDSKEEIPDRALLNATLLEAKTLRTEKEDNLNKLNTILKALEAKADKDNSEQKISENRTKALIEYTELTAGKTPLTKEDIIKKHGEWVKSIPNLSVPKFDDTTNN